MATKFDGSGKGGIAVIIQDQLSIPSRFLGTDKKPDPFSILEKKKFIREIL